MVCSGMEGASRLIWVRVKIEQESWVFILTYGKGSEKSEEKSFWNELNECVGVFCRNESVVMLGDFNGIVGNEVIGSIV